MGVLRIGPSALEGVGVRRVAMEMGQAPGDWQQESGSHCLDPVPERSLSVFLGWGWGSHWERQPSSGLLPVSLYLFLFLCLCLPVHPPHLSMCLFHTFSFCISLFLYLCLSPSLSLLKA